MQLFGTTRSRVATDHALICPESFVRSPLPGWHGASGVVVIGPQMGARFAQYLAEMEPKGTSAPPAAGVERFFYVLEGTVVARMGGGPECVLEPGGYAFTPAGTDCPIRAVTPARLNVFEKRYTPLADLPPPFPVLGREQDVEGQAFLGDPDARLQVLLPDSPPFDLAVNVFRFRPGAALPLVEAHVMEHGLIMLEGQGVYRLGDSWYPVKAGDVIWMRSFCPQWFVAMGKTPAAYLYYKDVNRDPLGGEP